MTLKNSCSLPKRKIRVRTHHLLRIRRRLQVLIGLDCLFSDPKGISVFRVFRPVQSFPLKRSEGDSSSEATKLQNPTTGTQEAHGGKHESNKKHIPRLSMTLKKWGHCLKLRGQMGPFSRGHGHSRFQCVLDSPSDP